MSISRIPPCPIPPARTRSPCTAYVLTRDPNDPAAALATSRVTQVFRHVATDLQRVSITDADGNVETYDVTDEHPFYVQGQGWVAAADLVPGEQVQGEDGVWETVTENLDDKRPEGIVVYNFEVQGSHTYFVEDGLGDESFGVWVHNTCGDGGTYLLRDPKTKQVARTGRTNNLIRRKLEHARDPVLKKYVFEEVHRTNDYAQLRGLEQLLWGKYKAPLNKIRGIAENNPNLQKYLDAAKEFLNI